jgi:hypothetical protein
MQYAKLATDWLKTAQLLTFQNTDNIFRSNHIKINVTLELQDEILSWTGTNALVFYFFSKPCDFHMPRMFYALTCSKGFISL